MLTFVLDAVMERRARQLIEQVRAWLPAEGPLLDLGSGTGHLAAQLEQESGLDVVTADVSDMHVTGRPPILIADGALPFDDGTFSAALLLFMLAYPGDPVRVLAEASRVAKGRVIVVQTLYSGRFGHTWHRMREFIWTIVAFHASRLVGYVPNHARFSMHTLRFFTSAELECVVTSAGLRIRARRVRPVLPGGALVVAGWLLERDD